MWTVEYQREKGGRWFLAGVVADDADGAWRLFSLIVASSGMDYYAAQAFGPPASLVALAEIGAVF